MPGDMPGADRWAVLVNEFGDVPIDQAAFGGTDDTIAARPS